MSSSAARASSRPRPVIEHRGHGRVVGRRGQRVPPAGDHHDVARPQVGRELDLRGNCRSLTSRISGLVLMRLMSAKLGLTDTTSRSMAVQHPGQFMALVAAESRVNRCGGAVVSSIVRTPCRDSYAQRVGQWGLGAASRRCTRTGRRLPASHRRRARPGARRLSTMIRGSVMSSTAYFGPSTP